MEKIANIDSRGLHLVDGNIMKTIEGKKLSASMINQLVDGCHASWVAQQFVVPEFIVEEPDNPRTRGSLFHKVMEFFFALPPAERTKEAVVDCVDKALNFSSKNGKEDFTFFNDYPDAVVWLKKVAVNGYWKLLSNHSSTYKSSEIEDNPADVNIATIQLAPDKQPISGLEAFVTAHIGGNNVTRDTLGFIDRLIVSPDDPTKLRVQDWKSGGKIKKYNGRSTEGLGEKRQQYIYGLILQELGYEVDKVQLIFPASMVTPQDKNVSHKPGVLSFDFDDEEFKNKVLEDIAYADSALTSIIENNTAEFSPSVLCAWCPIAKICPARDIKSNNKCLDAFAQQPTPKELSQGISVSA